MDLENEKIGPAYKAPDSYFKESESRLMQRIGIDPSAPVTKEASAVEKPLEVLMKVDTTGIQKRARKQDPLTSKSVAVEKEVDSVGKVEIAPLTFTTNENPEWVNFSAIPEDTAELGDALNITKVSYGDLLNSPVQNSETSLEQTPEVVSPVAEKQISVEPAPVEDELPSVETETIVETLAPDAFTEPIEPTAEISEVADKVIIHEVPESVGLDELESYIAPLSTVKPPVEESVTTQEEPPVMNLEAPPTAFAPIAGRQSESATPGWLGIAASLAAIVAAYFIWNAIQPPKAEETVATVLQQDEPTSIETPLDEPITPKDTIPDGLQLVEPLITGEMPKYKEPNVYTIIDAKEMPPRTKRALQDLEDNGLATFDMEDELFEELDFESL